MPTPGPMGESLCHFVRIDVKFRPPRNCPIKISYKVRSDGKDRGLKRPKRKALSKKEQPKTTEKFNLNLTKFYVFLASDRDLFVRLDLSFFTIYLFV